jgi:hypothetical protein
MVGDKKIVSEEEVYSDAFDQAGSAGIEDITPKIVDDAGTSVIADDNGAAGTIEIGDNSIAGTAGTFGTAGEMPARKAGESDEAYKQRYNTLQGIHKKEKADWETDRANYERAIAERDERLAALAGTASTAGTSAENRQDTPTLKDIMSKVNLTDEQKAALAEYEEEFDVVSKMEGLKRDQAMAALKAEMLAVISGMEQKIQSQLEPVNTFVKETAESREAADKEAHFQTIRDGHPDYETYRDNGSIIKWIETKPSYLQKGLKDVYSKGTAEDIVELLDDFKAENNIKPSNVVNLNQKKAERKAALTPPVTRRGAVNASMTVANDFEGAFDEATAKLQ